MRKLLESKKISITDFRISVLEIFEKYSNALAMDQIESELGEFDRITLYRTIKLFKKHGIIHEITIAGNPVKFALCNQSCEEGDHQHNHIHFRCNKCEEVYCVDIEKIPQIGLKGFQIHDVEIQASGICNKCA